MMQKPGTRGVRDVTARGAYRIQYWALTTSQKPGVRRRPRLVECRPRGPHCRARSREQARTEIPPISLQSLLVEAPRTRENPGIESAQSNGGRADEYRCLRQHHADGRTRSWLRRR